MGFGAILFDCDGVLVDSEVVGLEDAAEFLRGHGLDWAPRDLIARFTGMRTDLFRKGLRAAVEDAQGAPLSDAAFDTLFEGFIDTRRARRHTMTAVPGALSTVKAAAALDGVALAVASSSAQSFLDDKVNRYGFAPFFVPHVYSADHVANGKPAPDIFLFAAERVGVDPDRCLVIEDSPHGVAAGVASGAEVWGFTGGGHCLEDHAERLTAEGASRVVADHEALAALIAAL